MNRIAYRVTLIAPGLPAGHRFDIPADLVPTTDETTVLDALSTASTIAQDTLILRIQPIYETAGTPRQRDTSKRPRQRLLAALSDFIATCKDEPLRQSAQTLKTNLV